MVIIRKALETDIPYIEEQLAYMCALHSKARPDIFLPSGIKYREGELLSIIKSETVLVAVNGGEPCGYLIAKTEEKDGTRVTRKMKTLYVDDLCVDEAHRGLGAGEALMKAAYFEAGKLGCYDVTLNVWIFRGSALGFYEKMGMKPMSYKMEYILGEEDKSI